MRQWMARNLAGNGSAGLGATPVTRGGGGGGLIGRVQAGDDGGVPASTERHGRGPWVSKQRAVRPQ
jgi:hypothetical protein